MTGLGYEKYAAQGGDWVSSACLLWYFLMRPRRNILNFLTLRIYFTQGSVTARILGTLHSDHCKAVHLNFCPAPPSPSFLAYIPTRFLINNLPKFLISDLERERGGRALLYLEKGSAYYAMQALTPRTAAYGLNDSPIGLLAWIGEKIGPFVNIAGGNSQTPTLTRKDILTACSLYWLSASSFDLSSYISFYSFTIANNSGYDRYFFPPRESSSTVPNSDRKMRERAD